MANFRSEVFILMEEVDDLIDENPLDKLSIEDTAVIVSKLDQKRSSLRKLVFGRKPTETDDDDEKHSAMVATKFSAIREYIKASTEFKSQKREQEKIQSRDLAASMERSNLFVIKDIQRIIKEVDIELLTSLDGCNDAQLIQLKKETQHITSKLDKISQKYELLKSPISSAERLADIEQIGSIYNDLTRRNITYNDNLNHLIDEREIYKQRAFDESKLNISLEKFGGYDSATNIYIFQTTFNKLYLQTTPKRMLPDLLKNNHLKGSALTLVKSLNDIDQIWKSLKSAYGDTKVLLANHLQKLSNINSLHRTKDPVLLMQSITNLINTLKELMKLAKDHHIEENLFYGDGLDRIYNIIGDARLTRWLSSVTEEDLSPMETWLKFIAFLEKEQKLQQQKLLIFNKGHDGEHSKSSTNTHPKPHKVHHSNRAHHSGSSKEEVTCAICNSPAGTNDHISTNDPAKSQLIQYFTCQKFAELTPVDRLSMLKKKGYCIQCLFPGANTSIGRHKDGKCQREFTCPHQSHLKYPVRKHVLVCEEHKDDKENQDLLENYKQRCMKNTNLPDFARNISISFHAAFNCKTPSCEEDSVNDKGIYLLPEHTCQ